MEMRTAAEARLVEEERKKEIIQAEKDLTYPQRAVDAALTLQTMYYGWKAVQAVRQMAFQVYLKHFNTNYRQYYWENTRLGTTSWRLVRRRLASSHIRVFVLDRRIYYVMADALMFISKAT